QRVEHADAVAAEVEQRVVLDRLRLVGLAIAAHVGRDGVIARLRQRDELMAPRVPRLRKAMTHDDERALTGLRDVHPDPVRLDDAMANLGHSISPIAATGTGTSWPRRPADT